MRYASPRSEHERRLVQEGAFLARLFTQLAPNFGVFTLGLDGFVLGLVERLDLDLPGLTAIRIRVGDIDATAITAPGIVFGHPRLLADLKRLRHDAQDRGRRIVIIYKRSLKAHARGRLPDAALVERRGRSRSDRRRSKSGANINTLPNARGRVPCKTSSSATHPVSCGLDLDA